MNQPLPSEQELGWAFEQLPWYVNGSLGPEERGRMASLLARSALLREWLTSEQALSAATADMVQAPPPGDLGLHRLMSRVRAERETAQHPWLQRALGWLQAPQWAPALALVALVQAGGLAWLAWPPTEAERLRSVGVSEVRTLRVRFVATATEREIRAVLVKSGARIVGGPTQWGEYWIASDLGSLDEVKAELLQSMLTQSIDVDLHGPRGR